MGGGGRDDASPLLQSVRLLSMLLGYICGRGGEGGCVGRAGDSDRITTEHQKKKKKYKVKGGRVENGWRLRDRVTMHGRGMLFVPRVAWLSAPQ